MSDPFVYVPLAENSANPETNINDNFGKAKEKFDIVDDEIADLEARPVGIGDAPSNGKAYNRKDGGWSENVASASGIPEAPTDGKLYGRKNGQWVEIKTEPEVVAHRYWRVRIDVGNNDVDYIGAVGMQFRNASGTNLVPNGAPNAFASSQFSVDYSASRAFAPYGGNGWLTAGNSNPVKQGHIGYDFGSAVSIASFIMVGYFRPAVMAKQMRMQWSDDGVTYTDAQANRPDQTNWKTDGTDVRTFAVPGT